MTWTGDLLALTHPAVLGLYGLSLMLALYRLIRGPGLPDRVVALDLVAMIVVAMILLDAMRTGHYHFLRAAIALSLTSFVGAAAFAAYLHYRKDSRP